MSNELENHLTNWQTKESCAEAMIPLVGNLYRNYNIVSTIYGRSLVNKSVIEIIKNHRFVEKIENIVLEPKLSLEILQIAQELNLGMAHLDIGKLGAKFIRSGSQDLRAFLNTELQEIIDKCDKQKLSNPQDVVLYGFGRIGRLLARILIQKSGGGSLLRLRAIVIRGDNSDLEKRASLLRRDSVHGRFKGTVLVDKANSALIINGNFVQIIYSSSPSEVDYEQYGIKNALLVDNTGKWRDEAGLAQHLNCKGIDRVLLTAPGKGDLKNIVFGVNDNVIEDSDKILSAASCTTNAIVPTLKVINDKYGINRGHVETVHSYTNDQNLIDNYHKADRRGRSAPLNMVITETGAAKAATKALPELAGKLTGNAIRVPTPNVSLAILNLELEKEFEKDELNKYLRWISLYSDYQKQVEFIDSTEVVSSDFVGNRHAGIVDGQATIVNGKSLVLYVWYDNEFGYSCQVVRVLQKMSHTNPLHFPKPE